MDWNRRAAVFLAFAGSAVAQAEGKLDLSQLVREALERNPEILAAQKKYEAARQRPAQEGALPDPMFSAGWNSSGNPLPGAGLGTEPVANIGAMLSQPLPYLLMILSCGNADSTRSVTGSKPMMAASQSERKLISSSSSSRWPAS